MGLNDRGYISIAQIIAYAPVLALSGILVRRHGVKKTQGWIYLVIFSLGESFAFIRSCSALCLYTSRYSSPYYWSGIVHHRRRNHKPFQRSRYCHGCRPEHRAFSVDSCYNGIPRHNVILVRFPPKFTSKLSSSTVDKGRVLLQTIGPSRGLCISPWDLALFWASLPVKMLPSHRIQA